LEYASVWDFVLKIKLNALLSRYKHGTSFAVKKASDSVGFVEYIR
jgi:hypothetical protein